MVGLDINVYDITSQYTIAMVKTLLTERVGLREYQISLFLQRTTLEDGRILALYNVDNDFILLIVERLRGGPRTRRILSSRVNSTVLLDTVQSGNLKSLSSENSDT